MNIFVSQINSNWTIEQDVLELRTANWVARREEAGPKTIEQIHKDAAMDAMSGTTSQPSLGAVIASTHGVPSLETGLDLTSVQSVNEYWEECRGLYAPFESGQKTGSSDVYFHEMPGGQVRRISITYFESISNLFSDHSNQLAFLLSFCFSYFLFHSFLFYLSFNFSFALSFFLFFVLSFFFSLFLPCIHSFFFPPCQHLWTSS